MADQTFFNAHHSPIGAFASLTLGCKGALGGLGYALRGPADTPFLVGLESIEKPGTYQSFPFSDAARPSGAAEDYDVEGLSDYQHPRALTDFADDDIQRQMGPATDVWTAGDITLTIYTPVRAVPDPEEASEDDLRAALVPAILVELTVDNQKSDRPRKAFLGYAGPDRTRTIHVWSENGLTGLAQGASNGIATDYPDTYGGVAWQAEAVLDPRHIQNLNFNLGDLGLLVATVPPRQTTTLRFAVGVFEASPATTGIETDYLYRSLFKDLGDALAFVLANADQTVSDCHALDAALKKHLSPDRALMLGHAVKSYYGSTQLLRRQGGRPLWVVNEGEYRMMNTFDLTVDQLFFELALNPWTVRNVLDLFVERYSYEDQVRFPGDETLYPGGIAFTHDMGVANHFTAPEYSSYEQAGLRGVFSYMSAEELVNWVLCAILYVRHTGDQAWLQAQKTTFTRVLQSLLNRDHPDPNQRNGIIGLDSDRCKGGAEITTYDSLDKSLGQARNNLYLAVKTWAAYGLLETVFQDLSLFDEAQVSIEQAQRAAATIVASADQEGRLPAVIGEGNEARLIPAIEGLVFPYLAGRHDLIDPEGIFGNLRKTLEQHFDTILKPGICLFPDGGWKLSSTSRNSWLSKIYLCQFVAETVLGKPIDADADAAHLAWLMDEDNRYFAWSDQMVAGKAHGSRYYPRGVTAALWLVKSGLSDIRGALLSPKTVTQAQESQPVHS